MDDSSVKETSDATFCCVLTHENVQVSWFKKGVKLLKSRCIEMRCEGKKHLLVLKNASIDDSGEISVQAENLKVWMFLGKIRIQNCTTQQYAYLFLWQQGFCQLDVTTTPVEFIKELNEQNASEGGTVTLECQLNVSNIHGKILYCS